jgi:hypothetical protein
MLRSLELHDVIYDETGRFIEHDLKYTVDPVRIGDDEWDVLTWAEAPEPNPMLGVIVGELIHDVRSALDHLIYELVSENDEDPGEHTQFPIYASEGAWIKDIVERDPGRPPSPIFGLSDDQIAVVRGVQPYQLKTNKQRLTHPLMHLLRMSNVDKHRTLHSTAFTARAPEYVRYEPAGYMAISKKQFRKPGTVIQKNAEIGRVKRRVIQVPPPGTQVQLRIRGVAELLFNEPGKDPITGLQGVGLIMWVARGIILELRPEADIPFPTPTSGQPITPGDIVRGFGT